MTFATKGTNVDQPTADTGSKPTPNSDDQSFLVAGERKFTSQEEVVTKLDNQDSHITNIESENATLRDEIASLKAEQEGEGVVLEELERMKKELSDKGLTPEQVQTLVAETIATSKQTDTRESNHKNCEAELVKVYGDEHISELAKQAAELGMTLEQADEMAYTNPLLFTRTFIKKAPVQLQTNTSRVQGVNTASLQSNPNTGYELKAPLDIRTSKGRTENFLNRLVELQG